MKPQIKNLVGAVLLTTGVGIILIALFFSYQIFTGEKSAPGVFTSTERDPQKETTDNTTSLTLEEQMEVVMEEQLQKNIGNILPLEKINKMLNLISWSVFAGIAILGGGRIGGLGIKLLKGEG